MRQYGHRIMENIRVIDRISKSIELEKVYGERGLRLLYGDTKWARFCSFSILPLTACHPFLSKVYGFLQKTRWSKRKILPFLQTFHVNPSEFLEQVENFGSFNDFFIRKLKPGARPIISGRDVAVLPADGRYLVYQDVSKADGFVVKGKFFCLSELLQDDALSAMYKQGSMVIARLCPTDYHRFHFPVHCTPSTPRLIQGPLYSVNPIALRKRIEILAQNKREITLLQTKNFGQVAYIEVGATFVGSVHQTFSPKENYAKGDEKGYFSFGGSSLILLFEPGRIQLDQDLVEASLLKVEVKGLMGQSLGRSLTP